MKKIFSLFAAVLMAGSMMAETTTVYSWDGNKASSVTEVGGTATAMGGNSNTVVGKASKTNWCLNLGKGYSNGENYIKITLNAPLRGGETITTGAFVSGSSKPTADMVYGINFAGENELTLTYDADDEAASEIPYLSTNVAPADKELTVPAAAAGKSEIWIYRKSGSTTLYVSKFVVTRESAPVANDTVFFVNAADWAAVKVHAWDGTAAGTEWPGLDATKADYQLQGKDVYYFVAAPGAYGKCIFNNGAGAQTGNLDWTAGKYYYNGSWMTRAELEAPVVVDMYIKHGWVENAWTWKQMTYDAETETYLLREIYGATGCNWNTSASDEGATWVANPTVVGNPVAGDSAVFALKNGEITITKIGEPSPEPTSRFLKHNWGGAGDWTWKEMTREGETSTYTLRDIYGGTGCNWNVVGNDAGATWVASPTLEGEPAVGDSAVFSLVEGVITITKIESEGPGPEPTVNYYLAGSMNTPAWGSVAMPGDSIVLNLEAGEHQFKVQLVEGNWDTALGFTAVNAECSSEGYYGNNDGNVCFTLTEAGQVKIKVVEGQICVTGVFTTPEPTLPQVDLKGINDDWAGVTMVAAEDKLTCSYTYTLTAGEYAFKLYIEGAWLGNNGTMTRENCTGWTMEENTANCGLTADVDGDYVFTYTYENGTMSVTFPAVGPTDINNIEAGKAVKMIENGQVVIIREGVRYNTAGQKL